MQKYYNISFIIPILILLCSCSKIVYVPVYKKSPLIKIESDIVRPVMLVTEKEPEINKADAIVQSYKICEARVDYLESVIKKVNNE